MLQTLYRFSLLILFGQSALLFAATKTVELSVLTYNVAGLPDIISSSKPSLYTKLISPKLNDYDIVLVQEDFSYHQDLRSRATHQYISEPDCDLFSLGSNVSASGLHCLISLGDGLNTFSRLPFKNFQRITWSRCNGHFTAASDCLTPKGFSFAEHEVAQNKFIHIYNLHQEAGSSPDDNEARQNNFQQLARFINTHSRNAAIIVAGDMNSWYHEGTLKPDLINKTNLKDSWIELRAASDESIDKIFFRSSNDILITPLEHHLEKTRFRTHNGLQLSDHYPVSAKFQIVVNMKEKQ